LATKFGFLSRLEFLQNWSSWIISRVNPAVIHNIEKYYAIKKVHYLSSIEDIEGDYLEFGVYTSSSFCHSIRCFRNSRKLASTGKSETRFIGFDSFEGFGEVMDGDEHSFYTDENFSTSYDEVDKRVNLVSKGINYKLVKGFFKDSLKDGPKSLGISKSLIIFIDSDTYSSASEALLFCAETIQEGTFIILDDYYSYKGSRNKGVAKAFNELIKIKGLDVRKIITYGMGGAVYIVSAMNKKQ
jgi:O-methyltransferase